MTTDNNDGAVTCHGTRTLIRSTQRFSFHASSTVDKLDPVGEPSDAVSSVEDEAKVAERVTLAPPVRAGPSLVGCCARVSCA